MKKQFLFFAVAALALASCSSENDVVQAPAVEQTADDGAVNFDVYVGRGLSRGGVNGPVTTDLLKDSGDEHGKAGFGVFGYYTDGEPYSAITKPNFFYNQQVKYESGNWTYTPLKYWPNEFGSDAASDQVDRVTLFAYLPWVEVDPLTGVTKAAGSTADPVEKKAKDPTTNITGMTRNTSTGDPFVKYVATMDPTNSVDLCYGVAAENFTSSNSAINQNEIEKGKPYIDVKKPGTDANSKIKFDFKHATAQLKVTIDANVTDLTTPGNAVQIDYTRIWVRSVTFTGITQKGSLNLNSNADSPEWYDLNGNSKITTGSLTVYDGRKDGKEANDAASNESPATLNPKIVQAKQYTIDGTPKHITAPTEQTGVTETRVDLFGEGNSGAPVFVIPTKEKMRVTIVYDVETYDPNLPYFLSDGKTPGSSIENTIYKDIETFGEIEAGYCYTLNLHLGMRTVDFDAVVTPWQYYGADVDLPSNVQTFAAASGTGNSAELTLPADLTPNSSDPGTYVFAVSGLKVNGTVSVDVTTDPLDGSSLTATATTVNGAGISTVTISGIADNTTLENKTGKWIVNDGDGNKVTINVKQAAGALGMSVKGVAGSYVALNKATSSDWDFIDFSDPTKIDDQIKVWRNGQKMSVINSAPTNASEARYYGTTGFGRVYFNSSLEPGETVTIWIKAKDAAEESVTANIGGIAFVPTSKTVEFGQTGEDFQPIFTGYGIPAYTWTPTSGSGAATVADGVITIQDVGNVTVTATLDETTINNNKAKGYFFTTETKTASYTLTVAQAKGTISFENEEIEKTVSELSTAYEVQPAKLKNSKGDVITEGSSSIVYTVTTPATGNTGTYSLTSGTSVTVVNATAGDRFTVTATVTGNEKADYTDHNTASYTVIVK